MTSRTAPADADLLVAELDFVRHELDMLCDWRRERGLSGREEHLWVLLSRREVAILADSRSVKAAGEAA